MKWFNEEAIYLFFNRKRSLLFRNNCIHKYDSRFCSENYLLWEIQQRFKTLIVDFWRRHFNGSTIDFSDTFFSIYRFCPRKRKIKEVFLIKLKVFLLLSIPFSQQHDCGRRLHNGFRLTKPDGQCLVSRKKHQREASNDKYFRFYYPFW
jgi:hypothetical protein